MPGCGNGFVTTRIPRGITRYPAYSEDEQESSETRQEQPTGGNTSGREKGSRFATLLQESVRLALIL
jgi:hypothetical protein